jgi:methyltransferase-like protein/trans-aconitate methyltransferase
MSEPKKSLYDDVLYPSSVYPQTHPDRLATLATLFGMRSAPVERCRVLELGCNDGSNLIAMAYGLPQSQCIGIDVAERPIAQGKAIVEELGLKNVTLHRLDLRHTPSDLGRFDFIIAHGLYSWIPADLRDALLAVCGKHLTDQGVAYVSYNAYPGNHFRDMVRGMMRYHTAHFPDLQQHIPQARALLKFLAESKAEPEPYHMVLAQELKRVLSYPDAGFFHDDLSPINHPVYFHEFIAHATRHGLQYLSEADFLAMQEEAYPPHVSAVLHELDPDDVIGREQYLDFLRCRAFRQTLLCRYGVQLDRSLKPERLQELYVAAEVRPASPTPDLTSRVAEVFHGPEDAEIETDRPVVKTALAHLGTLWPRSVHFGDLLAQVRRHLGRDDRDPHASAEADAQEMGRALLQAYGVGYVELHAHQSPFVTAVSERPIASPLARLQLQHDNVVATLRHHALRIEGDLSRHLIMLLDGTRDRATLLRDLGALVESGAATVSHEGKPVRDVQEALQYLADELEANLMSLARSAVLVA